MDIHNSTMDIQDLIMDIHNSIMDIHNSIDGYPKIDLWISIILIYGYPLFGIMDIHNAELWTIIRFMDVNIGLP